MAGNSMFLTSLFQESYFRIKVIYYSHIVQYAKYKVYKICTIYTNYKICTICTILTFCNMDWNVQWKIR